MTWRLLTFGLLRLPHSLGVPIDVIILVKDAAQHVCLLLPFEALTIAEALLVEAYSVVVRVWWKR